MQIEPITGESMGTRSMAIFIKTKNVNVFIDPGVSLAPSRWHLPPHPKEIKKRDDAWKKIKAKVSQSDIAIITHYHYDHYNPQHPEIFSGKHLLIKHPNKNINKSQKGRASTFLDAINELEASKTPHKIPYADGKTFTFGETEISFSRPVPHGAKTRLGFVTEVFIDDTKDKLIYTSDVEGPCREDQITFILEHKPEYLLVDGPMTYLLGFRYPKSALEHSIEYLKRILQQCPIKKLAVDHHALRKKDWKSPLEAVFEKGKEKITTLAGLADKEVTLLEAYRRELYGKREEKGPLLKIPGIGEKMKERLIKYFGGISSIKNAKKEELIEVNGIGEKTAENIIKKLQKEVEK